MESLDADGVLEDLYESPTSNSFTLWYHRNDDYIAWSDNLLEITTGSPNDILKELNNFGLPSSRAGTWCDVCIFRSHIVPMWEDPYQIVGGRWTVELSLLNVDVVWFRTVMALFRATDNQWTDVTGLYLMIRPKMRIALWHSNGENSLEETGVINYWKKVIGLDLGPKIHYKCHGSVLPKNGRITYSREETMQQGLLTGNATSS